MLDTEHSGFRPPRLDWSLESSSSPSIVTTDGRCLPRTRLASDASRSYVVTPARRPPGKNEETSMIAKNTICLWFNKDAEEAARFYAATFPDSKVTAVHKAPGDFPGGKAGDALTVEFTVFGIPCLGLNGGPHVQTNRSVLFPDRHRQSGGDRPLLERHRRQRRRRKASAVGARIAGGCPGRSPRAR